MNPPKVTVVMAVYNGEKCLREAIDSILNQTFKDFEFLIINDGSTDKTPEIIAGYNDQRIVIANQKNIDLTKSLNKAIKLSRGEYIARMDADDISLPRRLELEVAFLDNHEDVGLVGTMYYHIDKNDKILSVIPVPIEDEMIQEKLLKGNCFAHSSIMVRTEVLKKVGYYREEFKLAQDYDLFLRIAECCKVRNLEEALHQWRVVEQGITINRYREQNRYADLARRLAKKRRAGLDENIEEEIKKLRFMDVKFNEVSSKRDVKKIFASHFCSYGIVSMSQGKRNEGRKHFLTSIRYYPLRVKPYIFLCLTYLPLTITNVLRAFKKKCNFLLQRLFARIKTNKKRFD